MNIADQFQSALRNTMMRRQIKRWTALLPKVASYEEELMKLDAQGLRKRSLSLQYRLKSQEASIRVLPEAYALVREAGRRTLNMRHFDVQILGGIAMHHRAIVEMQTGEGKTLTATLPLYLAALEGKGAHLTTVNDYLARRDAEWMRPLYEALGISVGVIESQMSQNDRRKNYACDVTYGTAKEFGFDFLRDRLLLRRIGEGQADFLGGMLGMLSEGGEKPVQRTPYFVLVDEADSILIDEARTPLIISGASSDEQVTAVEAYKWAATICDEFEEDEHFEYDYDDKKVELTAEGRRAVRHASQARIARPRGHVHHLRTCGARDQGESRVLSGSPVRGARRRNRDHRRIHGSARRRPQVAGRYPPGHRGRAGRARSHARNRTGGADHRAGLFPAVSECVRHDGHRGQQCQRAAKDLQGQSRAHSHESPGDSPAPA